MGSLYKRSRTGNYYGEFTDARGERVRKSTGTANKSAASRILQKWEADANLMRHGVGPAASASLEVLLGEYLEYIGNTSEAHRTKTENRLRRMIDATGWMRPADITQYQLETVIRRFTDPKSGEKLSARTQGHYITAAKMFVNWLVDIRHALPRSPIAAAKKPNWQGDRKRVRRFLLPDEWPWLAKSPHALLYETAIQTGFRAGEIQALQPKHLGEDFLFLPAKLTKPKRDAKQYITADLRERLVGALPFDVPEENRLAELLREDLAAVREVWVKETKPKRAEESDFLCYANHLSHVLDFHSLRHTCGAWLALAGVNPKVIQTVMRHSTITLTLDTYGHLMPGAERDAVQHFARLMAVDLCHNPDSD